jgi:hypothetical protein
MPIYMKTYCNFADFTINPPIMKNVLSFSMALFLFFTISCQKQELVIPNKEYQEVVYNFTLEGGNDDSI